GGERREGCRGPPAGRGGGARGGVVGGRGLTQPRRWVVGETPARVLLEEAEEGAQTGQVPGDGVRPEGPLPAEVDQVGPDIGPVDGLGRGGQGLRAPFGEEPAEAPEIPLVGPQGVGAGLALEPEVDEKVGDRVHQSGAAGPKRAASEDRLSQGNRLLGSPWADGLERMASGSG